MYSVATFVRCGGFIDNEFTTLYKVAADKCLQMREFGISDNIFGCASFNFNLVNGMLTCRRIH